jgi:hypothetical protein
MFCHILRYTGFSDGADFGATRQKHALGETYAGAAIQLFRVARAEYIILSCVDVLGKGIQIRLARGRVMALSGLTVYRAVLRNAGCKSWASHLSGCASHSLLHASFLFLSYGRLSQSFGHIPRL